MISPPRTRATGPTTHETRLGLSLALGGLTIVLDTTITVVAVPVLVRVFDAPLATMQWTTTAYVLGLIATLPLAAWLGARIGHRRAYVLGLLGFAVASAWAGLAHGPSELIAARALQGIAGGLINPLGMTIGLRGVPAGRRGRMAALLGLPVLVGPLVGPALAGWLIDTLSWRAIFFLTVPPALLAAILVRRIVAPDDPEVLAAQRTRLDVAGTLLLLPGSVGIVYAVADAQVGGPVRLAVGVAGVLLLGAFVRRSLRHEAPLLRVGLLGDPVFGPALLVLALFAAAYFGSMLLTPTYVQITRGDPAALAGSLGVPAGLATGLSLQMCTRLVDRVRPALVVRSGLAVAAAASALGIVVLRADTSYVVIGGLGALLGLGAGAVLMPVTTIATRDLDGADLASASSLIGLASQLANALGTAAITALFGALVVARAGVGLDEASGLPAAARTAAAPDLVDAQRLTQLLTLGLILVALTVAGLRLRGRATPSPQPALQEAS